MVSTIREVMDLDYGQGLKRKMDGVYSGVRAIGGGSKISSGGLVGGGDSLGGGGIGGISGANGGIGGVHSGGKDDEERGERELRATFVVYANDLDISAGHLDRLLDELLESDAIPQAFLTDEVEKARSAVRSLSSLSDKFRVILKVSKHERKPFFEMSLARASDLYPNCPGS